MCVGSGARQTARGKSSQSMSDRRYSVVRWMIRAVQQLQREMG